MKFLEETPAKAWDLTAYAKGGKEYILTGWDGGWSRAAQAKESYRVPNRIVSAAIQVQGSRKGRSSVTFMLTDSDPEQKLTTGVLGMQSILQALQKGLLKLDKDGWIVGHWTFQKQGDEVYLFPVDPISHKIFKGEDNARD